MRFKDLEPGNSFVYALMDDVSIIEVDEAIVYIKLHLKLEQDVHGIDASAVSLCSGKFVNTSDEQDVIRIM